MVPGPSAVRDQLARCVAGWRTSRAVPPRLASPQPEGPPASWPASRLPARRDEPAASAASALPQAAAYPENQCAGAGLVLW